MKKILAILAFLACFTGFALAVIMTPSNILNLLNWGDYISQDLIDDFETQYHCQVVQEDVPSSESMYQKITANTSNYDVVIPGDYTVHQLYEEGYLQRLDVDNPELKNLHQYQTLFQDSLAGVMKTYMVDDEGKPFNDYYMPYFWGSYVTLYSTNKPDVESVIRDNGFKAFFDRSLFKETVGIGMYDTARWMLSCYLMANGYDPNITSYDGSEDGDLSKEIAEDAKKAIRSAGFDTFGNDQLKKDVANGKLDFCFTQLGDFFDTLYLVLSQTGNKDVSFSVSVPSTTAAFFDSMIIPKTAKNTTLANQFINFMLDPENAYDNANVVGYSPTLQSVDDLFASKALAGEAYVEDDDGNTILSLSEFLDRYPMYLNPLYGATDVYMLKPKSNTYLTTCETIYNSLA